MKNETWYIKSGIFFMALCVLLTACASDRVNMDKAKECAENCLMAIDKGEYAKVRNDFYTSEFVRAETEEELTEKFKKLKEVTGPMKSFELTESKAEAEIGEEACVNLTYVVKHERVTTREEFVIVIESGKHKIGSHLISNE